MAGTMKVRCDRDDSHINDVDPDEIQQPTVIFRAVYPGRASADRQQRFVLPCRFCTAGRVVITQAMIDHHQRNH